MQHTAEPCGTFLVDTHVRTHACVLALRRLGKVPQGTARFRTFENGMVPSRRFLLPPTFGNSYHFRHSLFCLSGFFQCPLMSNNLPQN